MGRNGKWGGRAGGNVEFGEPTPDVQVEMVLPAYGMMGQREDLRCVRNAGYAPAGPDDVDCLVRYRLDRPGRYRVVARYSPPNAGRFRHPVIADTTVLVVQ